MDPIPILPISGEPLDANRRLLAQKDALGVLLGRLPVCIAANDAGGRLDAVIQPRPLWRDQGTDRAPTLAQAGVKKRNRTQSGVLISFNFATKALSCICFLFLIFFGYLSFSE